MKAEVVYDFAIIGAGFAGSITAMALANSGFRVCLIEKEKHPRFAIGESSTPIADMVLRDLAEQYNLPFLKKMSRYGEWQKHYPDITCGLKRGFSYFRHQKGEVFTGDKNHSRELLVAASENDFNSDTNWLRSDVDHFLAQQAKQLVADYFDESTIQALERIPSERKWDVQVKSGQKVRKLSASWLIDATGSPSFSENFLGTHSSSSGFETYSSALFSHFEGAEYWSRMLKNGNAYTDDYPYNPDYSALHHLLDEGWMWMLRFNNDLLSAGVLVDENHQTILTGNQKHDWNSIISQYPSLAEIFKKAEPSDIPGRWIATNRLQRKLNKTFGEGWLALHHTSGFVDPLHSTGIAHTLTGIEKLLNIFSAENDMNIVLNKLQKVEDQFFNELEFIDRLVSICYQTRNNFNLFSACTMLYFAASVTYEQGRLRGDIPEYFLCADSSLFDAVESIHYKIKSQRAGITSAESEKLISEIRKKIEPFNTVGLMNPDVNNMYRHTAAVL